MVRKSSFVLVSIATLIAVALGVVLLRDAALREAPEPEKLPAATADASLPPSPPVDTSRPRVGTRAGVPDNYDAVDGRSEQERILSGLQKLELKFQSQPVSPAWAMQQENMIAGVFAPEALKAAAAPAPITHEASCRSTTCRITAVYKTELDEQVAQLSLLGSIAPSLPSTIFGEVRGEDGSVQLVMYASVGKGGPPRLPHRE